MTSVSRYSPNTWENVQISERDSCPISSLSLFSYTLNSYSWEEDVSEGMGIGQCARTLFHSLPKSRGSAVNSGPGNFYTWTFQFAQASDKDLHIPDHAKEFKLFKEDSVKLVSTLHQ